MQTSKLINMISIRLKRRSGKTGRLLSITEAQGRVPEFTLAESKDKPLFQKDIEKKPDLRSSTATKLLKTPEE